MAIIPSNLFPGQVAPATEDYPLGSARNISAAGAQDGTPWRAALLNDIWGLLQGLLKEANITPNGNPDTARASQYVAAINALIEAGVEGKSNLGHGHDQILERTQTAPPFDNANRAPRAYHYAGLCFSFVEGVDGWPIDYARILNIPSYSAAEDGGAMQILIPYQTGKVDNDNFMWRVGRYNNAGWTGWKTALDKGRADGLYLTKSAFNSPDWVRVWGPGMAEKVPMSALPAAYRGPGQYMVLPTGSSVWYPIDIHNSETSGTHGAAAMLLSSQSLFLTRSVLYLVSGFQMKDVAHDHDRPRTDTSSIVEIIKRVAV